MASPPNQDLRKLGDAFLRHYERFFGEPDASESFTHAKWGSIRFLSYAGRFDDAILRTYVSFGFGRHPYHSRPTEVALVVEGEQPELLEMLAMALFWYVDAGKTPDLGSAIDGLGRTVPSFFRRTGMDAFYFGDMHGLPSELTIVHIDSECHGLVRQVFPLRKAEYRFHSMNGPDALEESFARANVDLFSLDRESAVAE